MYQSGLVLEGGGMKGVYTAGVLDFFLDKGIEFSNVYGVSMGACDMCSYLSKQRGRARDVIIDYADQKYYFSMESLMLTGNLFNTDMCYHLIPDYLHPYDHEAFEKYEGNAYSVVTDIVLGKPRYFRIKDLRTDIVKIQASASLPLVARNVEIEGGLYLDGGISDSIPIRKSIMDGNVKNVVIMTKEKGYVRTATSKAQLALIKARYLKYPKVYDLMKERHIIYNECLDYLDRLEENGQVFVIRPQVKSEVGRIERDKTKLQMLYEQGYTEAESNYEELKKYLEG